MGVYVSTLGILFDNNIFLIYMASAFFILDLGLIDDFYPLSAKNRPIIQTVIILINLELTGLKFDTLGHSFGLKTQLNLGFFSYLLTVLGMLLVTNAFNLMDGADGVTGVLAILALSVIFLIEILSLNINSNPLTLALIGSLILFLSFNLIQSKNKIFLGDSGSLLLLIGFFIDSHFKSLSFSIFLLFLFLYIWFRSYSNYSRYISKYYI